MPGGLEVDLDRFDGQRPPALLLGGVNLVRALGLGGIPVIVGSQDADADAFASRHCAGRIVLPPPERRAAALEIILAAGLRLASAVRARIPLFYGDDAWLAFVCENRDRLAPYFLFAVNDAATAAALIDKDRFQALAARLDLPVPRTLSWEALDAWSAPVLVKPKLKIDAARSALQPGFFGAAKARIFPNGRALAADRAAQALRDELTLQEYVRGDDGALWSFHGFAREGELLADFVGRKLRTWPALTGESAYLELSRHEGLTALGKDLVRKLGLNGVFKMDFKQDAGSGAFRLLEINARYNLWHYLGAANGINLPKIAYDFLVHGERPAAGRGATRYGTRVRWLAPRLDARARRELGLPLFAWLASLACTPKVYDLFAWSDPGPFLQRIAQRARRRVLRLKPWPTPAK